ncbi:MAG: branched-chain amino acid ABC transporter permease [Candidatus Methanomethylicia archaeon]
MYTLKLTISLFKILKVKNTYRRSFLYIAPIIFLMLILPLIPFIPLYIIHFFILAFMYISLAQSWNIIGGVLGLVDFGHVVFFGMGAYTFTIAFIYYHLPLYISIILGGGAAALLALLLSPILRLRGAYFAIGMFVIAEAFRITFTNWIWVGGGGGMYIPIPEQYSKTFFYYIMFALAIITNYVTFLFINSKLGLASVAFRENYIAAYTSGINIVKIRLYGFILSALFPGLVGGVYAYYLSFIAPPVFFGEYLTALMIFMVVLGGRGTFIGPIIGALITIFLSQLITFYFPFYDLIIYSIIIIAIIIFTPEGIYGIIKHKF